jgi:hypothetical protein
VKHARPAVVLVAVLIATSALLVEPRISGPARAALLDPGLQGWSGTIVIGGAGASDPGSGIEAMVRS